VGFTKKLGKAGLIGKTRRRRREKRTTTQDNKNQPSNRKGLRRKRGESALKANDRAMGGEKGLQMAVHELYEKKRGIFQLGGNFSLSRERGKGDR